MKPLRKMHNFTELLFIYFFSPTIRLYRVHRLKRKNPALTCSGCVCAHAFVCVSLCLFQEAGGSTVWLQTQTVSCGSRTSQDLHSVLMSGSLARIREEKIARNWLQSRTEENYMRDAGTVPCHLLWPFSILGIKKVWRGGNFPMVQIQRFSSAEGTRAA